MIPSFDSNHVLPTWQIDPTLAALRSPWSTTIVEIVERLGTTPERRALIRMLVLYRNALRAAGLTSGYQWIDGSFVQDVERLRGRPPGDIDLVTFSRDLHAVAASDLSLVDPIRCREAFNCDAFCVDLTQPAEDVAQRVTYWFGLFGAEKRLNVPKGMLQIDVANGNDDQLGLDRLDEMEANP